MEAEIEIGPDFIEVRPASHLGGSKLEVPECIVQLDFHDEVQTGWWATVPCIWDVTSSSWRATTTGMRPPSRLVEVTLCAIGGNPVGLSPSWRFHLFSADYLTTISGTAAAAEAVRLSRAREALFSQPIQTAGVDANRTFSALFLVDRLLVGTQSRVRVPGIEITPIRHTTLGKDVAETLERLAPHFGYVSDMTADQWIPYLQAGNDHVGTAVVHLPCVIAVSAVDAHLTALAAVEQFLDLLGMFRQSRARMLGGVTFSLSHGREVIDWQPWQAHRPYQGNLMSGPLAGEEPRTLLEAWQAQRADPLAQLWLSLIGDALAEYRADLRIFRCFSLLDAIGKEVIGDSQRLRDEFGNPLLNEDGKQCTSWTASGRVFALLQGLGDTWAPAGKALHEQVRLWADIRNSVAHEGAWLRPDGPAGPEQAACYERVASHSTMGTVEQGLRQLDMDVTRACQDALMAVLGGRLDKGSRQA